MYKAKMPQSGVGSMQGKDTGNMLMCCVICHIMCHIMCHVMCGIMCRDAGRNTLVDLIFLRTVNILNRSLLPCLEVAYDA